MTYRIKNWDQHFENNRTRDLKEMEWVPIPNDLADFGYVMLTQHPAGSSHLGAWLVMVQVASRCDVRGTLRKKGVSLTPTHLSLLSKLPVEIFEEAIPRLLSPEIGWLEVVEESETCTIPQEGAGNCRSSRTVMRESAYARAAKGKERKGKEEASVICTPKDAREPETPPLASPQETPPEDPPEIDLVRRTLMSTYERMRDPREPVDPLPYPDAEIARRTWDAVGRSEITLVSRLMDVRGREKPQSWAWFPVALAGKGAKAARLADFATEPGLGCDEGGLGMGRHTKINTERF